jgi:hypothetical protein
MRLRIALPSLCTLVCACHTPPPAVETRAARFIAGEPEGIVAFETRQRERANALEQQGALLEAAQAWEVLALLKPGDYGRRLAVAQQRIEAQVQEQLARARQEHKRGEVAVAEQFYLGVIGLQPHNKEAGDALRAIERARIRQDHLLKAGRTVPPPESRRAAPPAPGNPLLLEQAGTLAGQGDVEEAIDLLAGHLKTTPGDQAARDQLADLLYKKAQSLPAKEAQAVLKRCLQVAPRHAGCNVPLAPANGKP